MEEINLEEAFGDMAAGESPQPVPEEAQVSPEEVEMVQEEAPAIEPEAPSQFDPSVIQNQMESQSEAISRLAESIEKMNEPKQPEVVREPTEEDLIRERARKELGLDEIDARYAKQEEMIKQQAEFIEQMKQQEMIRQRESQFAALEKEYGNIDRDVIQNKIVEIGQSNPQLAEALNSPEGVKMLLSQGIGAVVKEPDPITPSANATDVNNSDAMSRVLEGKGTNDDFGDLLASYV